MDTIGLNCLREGSLLERIGVNNRSHIFPLARKAHAMRNEFVEELIIDPWKKVLQNRMGNSSEMVKTDEMESNRARREKAEKTSGQTRHEVPLGEACSSEKKAVLSSQDPLRLSPTRAR